MTNKKQILRNGVLFLFIFLFKLNSFAKVSYLKTETELQVFDSENKNLKISLDINNFVVFKKVNFKIKEKLGSYKTHFKTKLKSSNLSLDSIVEVNSNQLTLKISFDFDKTRRTTSIKIKKIENKFIISVDKKSQPIYNRVSFIFNDNSKAIFGGGIQFSNCNLRGQKFPLIVEENGVGRGDKGSTFLANLVGAAGNEHTTYAPLPFFLTSKKMTYELFSSGNHFWEIDFTDEKKLTYSLNALERFDFENVSIKIKQDEPINLVSKKTETKAELKDWIYGYILGIQGGKQKVDSILNLLQSKNINPSAIWIQDWVGKRKTNIGSRLQWDWHKNEFQYPNTKLWIDSLHKENIKVLGYINPYFVEGGLQAKKGILNHYFVKDKNQNSYKFKAGGFNAYMIDLSNLEARVWMKNIIKKELIETGFNGWMCDFGEWLPFFPNLKNDLELNHNNFPVEWLKLNLEAAQEMNLEDELFIFNRSAYQGTQEMRNIMWLGDQLSNFGVNDGLASAVNAYNSASLSGFPITHSDIGGYTAIKIGSIKYLRNKELLYRWIEMEAFTPLFRSHEGLLPDFMEQIYSDEENMAFFEKFNTIHQELIPYFKKVNKEYIETGKPMIRHPYLIFPNDKNTLEIQYQFFVGNDLLVCPVVEEAAASVSIYLPEGNWEHFFTKKMYEGSKYYTIDAPLGEPTVFWKQ